MRNEHHGYPRTEPLRPGQAWSRLLRRGEHLRLVDVEGGAQVAALFFNAKQPLERYNMPDTLKSQHIARLTEGCVLCSDMGRVLCAIVADTCGWHDTITGHGTRRMLEARYGQGRYQQLRNDFYRNTRDNFLVELGKYGLGSADITANVNFFVKVEVEADGSLAWHAGNSGPGSYVELRAEMDVLIVLSNTPHPLDPAPSYAPKPVALELCGAMPATRALGCRTACAENGRAYALTEDYVGVQAEREVW